MHRARLALLVATLTTLACTEDAPEVADTAAPIEEVTADLPPADDTPDVGGEEDVGPPKPGAPADSEWPTFGRDQRRTGRSAFVGTRRAPETWSTSLESRASGSAVVLAGGRIAIGAVNGNLRGMEPDGSEAWVYSTGSSIDAPPTAGNEGVVYVGDFAGVLHAVESNGLARWTAPTGGSIRGAPALHLDGLVVVGSGDSKVHAFDLHGAPAWTFAATKACDATPSITESGTILAGCDDAWLYALTSEGASSWAFQTEGAIKAAPTVTDDGTVIVATLVGQIANVFALSPAGSLRWSVNAGAGIEVPAVLGADGLVVVATQTGTLIGLDGTTGEKRFQTEVGSAIRTSMAVGADGLIYAAAADTFAYAFEPVAGAEVAKFELGAAPSAGAVVLADGGLLFGAGSALKKFGGGGPCEGTPVSCDDQDPCTEDRCEPDTGCTNTFLCDDGNDCTLDSCNEDSSCVHKANTPGAPCDDGFACTTGGACEDTACVPSVNDCGPANSTWPLRGRVASHDGAVSYPAARTGDVRWTFETSTPISGSPVLGEDGTVYVGLSSKGAAKEGGVLALSSEGKELWRLQLGAKVSSTPAVTRYGDVYVGARDGNLTAVDTTGAVRWTYKTGDAIASSPTLTADGTILIGSNDGKLHAVRPSGVAAWTFAAGAPVSSTAAVGADGRIYFGAESGTLFALDGAGAQLWTATAGVQIGLSAPALAADGTIYVGSFDQRLYAFDSAGTKKWDKLTGGALEGSPALRPGGGVVIGSPDESVYAYNALGVLDWSFVTNGQVVGSPSVDGAGWVYIGTIQDVVASFYAIDAKGKEAFRLKVPGGVIAQPAIGKDGRVIVAGLEGRIIAVGGGGTCQGQDAPICDDGDPCTVDQCVEGKGCEIAVPCDDGNPCTQDLCDANGKCFYLPTAGGTPCDDGLACTLGDQCFSGQCSPTTVACPAMASSWPMRGQNPQRTGRATVPGPIGTKVKWTFDADRVVDGSGPVTAIDGTIYFGTCLCVDGFNGNVPTGECASAPELGIACTGQVYAVDGDGEGKWIAQTGDAVQATPVIGADGRIYVGNNAGIMTALDPEQGEPVWTYIANGQLRSSPLLGPQGQLIFGSKGANAAEGWLYHLTPAGTPAWVRKLGGEVRSSVSLSADGQTIYAASNDFVLQAVSLETNEVLWDETLQGIPRTAPLVTPDGKILVGTVSGHIQGFEPTGGPALFTTNLGGPVAADLGLALDGTTMASAAGQLVGLEPNGNLSYSFAYGNISFAGVVVDSTGSVLFASENGAVYAVKAPWFQQTMAELIVDDGPSGSIGLSANGYLLFTTTDGKLTAFGP